MPDWIVHSRALSYDARKPAYDAADYEAQDHFTLTTLDHLAQAIRGAGGDPSQVLFSLPIGNPGDHISHTDGAYQALPFAWFYYGMPSLDAFVDPWHRTHPATPGTGLLQ